jgi:D-alanyl-lipoteichoic acid acyltransferase DltB (MBOAT superfamily)
MVEVLKLMLWGFFMKLVVADRLALYVDSVYDNSAHHEGKMLALATVFFAIQILEIKSANLISEVNKIPCCCVVLR